MLEEDVTIWDLKQAIKQFFYEMGRPTGLPNVDDMSTFMKHQCTLSKQVENQIYQFHRFPSTVDLLKAQQHLPYCPLSDRQAITAAATEEGHGAVQQQQQQQMEGKVDALEHVQKAKQQWLASLTEELICISREKKEPLVMLRCHHHPALGGTSRGSNKKNGAKAAEQREERLLSGAERGEGVEQQEAQAARFLFDSEDLLDALAGIEGNSFVPAYLPKDSYWGLIKVQLPGSSPTLDLSTLQALFPEFAPHYPHMGLDDDHHHYHHSVQRFLTQRMSLGRKVLRRSFIPIIRQYAKNGIPQALRPQLWRLMLGLSDRTNEMEKAYFIDLQEHVDQYRLITDDLLEMDVGHMADDPRYFPFEEVLNQVTQSFARDGWIAQHSAVQVHQPISYKYKTATNNSSNETSDCVYYQQHQQSMQNSASCGHEVMAVPPAGVFPFRGFINYIAPICYMYTDPESIYFVIRAFWAQYWCKLNAIDSSPGHLVSLCKNFEDLVMHYHPHLFFHLINLGLNPLPYVMPWIQHGFVGYLEVEQVLVLWDRLLGYNSLLLLPLLSCAIFVFKSEALMDARDEETIQQVLADGSRLKVIPLLQSFLFP